MSIRIHCPNCQAGLSMPETMYGKSVRCPSCKTAFQCPPGPGGAYGQPVAPPPPLMPAPRPVPAAGNPFAMQPTPAAIPSAIPAAQPAYGDYDAPAAYAPRRGSGWSKVQLGLLLISIAAMCMGLSILIELLVVPKYEYRGEGYGAELRPNFDKEGPSGPDDGFREQEKYKPLFLWHGVITVATLSSGLASTMAIVNLLLFLAFVVLAIIGCAMLCGAPASGGTKGLASSAMISLIVCAVAGLAYHIVFLTMLFADPKSQTPGGVLTKFNLIAATKNFQQVSFVAAVVLVLLFLLLTATAIQQRGTALSVALFLVATFSLLAFSWRGEQFLNSFELRKMSERLERREREMAHPKDGDFDRDFRGRDERREPPSPPIWFYADYIFKFGLLTWFIIIAFMARSGIGTAQARGKI